MKHKLNIKKVIAAIKGNAAKALNKSASIMGAEKVSKNPAASQFRERNMMKEAMDIGAHGAKEMFGGCDVKTK